MLLGNDNSKEKRRGLSLHRLADGKCPCITGGQGRCLAEAASVCIDNQSHALTAALEVVGDTEMGFDLRRLAINDQMVRALADLKEATEFGAAGIAILLIEHLTEFHAVQRAVTRTGVDYWLAEKDDEDLSFSARLEVSGCLSGGQSERKRRVRQKLKQTKQSDTSRIPAIVAVVEFSELVAEVVKKL